MKIGPFQITLAKSKAPAVRPAAPRRRRAAYSASKLASYSTSFQATAVVDSADSLIYSEGDRIRRVARSLCRNNHSAKSIIRKRANRLVGGTGPMPRLAIRNAQAEEIERKFRKWAKRCDSSRSHSWAKMIRMALMEQDSSGESFLAWGGLGRGFAVQVYESEQLWPDFGVDAAPGRAGTIISSGIRYNAETSEKLSYIFTAHEPGGTTSVVGYRPIEIPGNRVAHFYDIERPSQTRGVSLFAEIARLLHERADIRAAELELVKAAAYWGVMITSDSSPDDLATSLGVEDDVDEYGDSERQLTMNPGEFNFLDPGDKPELLDTSKPSQDFQEFDKTLGQEMSAFADLSPAHVSGDYEGVNFSSARMADRANVMAEHYRRDDVENVIADRVFSSWLWAQVLGGEVRLAPSRVDAMLDGMEWLWPAVPYHDPTKEIDATAAELELGLKTWDQAVMERGQDPDEQLRQLEKIRKKAERVGVSIPGPWGAASGEQPTGHNEQNGTPENDDSGAGDESAEETETEAEATA